MNVTGALRVKNEDRWIARSLASLSLICQRIVVFDDHSTDATLSICRGTQKVEIIESPFSGLNESRDKNFLLDHIRDADWVVMIDGDEVLTNPGDLAEWMQCTSFASLSLPVFYLWDREDQIRVDGVYGSYRRHSAFRPGTARFHDRGAGANFHCGNVPASLRASRGYAESPLLHFGYLHREDRERKYAWYNERDPNNQAEDGYRHMVVGDLFPPESRFRHGGPLELRTIC